MLTWGGVVSPLPRAAQLKRTAQSNMKQKKNRTRAGSEAQYGPRLAGEILHDYLENSNDPLAVNYRDRKTNNLDGWNKNTVLSCILKTLLRSDRTMKPGKEFQGVLRRDAESEDFRYDVHYTFIETIAQNTAKRNPRVYNGTYLTITRWSDGSLHPNFKPMRVGEDFSVDSYAIGVCNELREALGSLLES